MDFLDKLHETHDMMAELPNLNHLQEVIDIYKSKDFTIWYRGSGDCPYKFFIPKEEPKERGFYATTYRMPFGKHQGLPLEEVPLSYIKWILEYNEHRLEKIDKKLLNTFKLIIQISSDTHESTQKML